MEINIPKVNLPKINVPGPKPRTEEEQREIYIASKTVWLSDTSIAKLAKAIAEELKK